MAKQTQFSNFIQIGKKIIAVGRNYSEHAAELGNPIPKVPMLFMKPTSAYITQGQHIEIPLGCKELHHEVELGVVVAKTCTNIKESDAMSYIAGYTLALDMTARDFQNEAKNKGHPWFLAKGFDTSCPVSRFIDRSEISDPQNTSLWLKVNGQIRQEGNTKDMIFTIPHLISYISQYFTLEPGDVILTGTPSGVSNVNSGDVIEAGLANNLVTMKFEVEKRK